jgi:hypothetical protein
MLFQEPLNEQDQAHYGAIVQKMELDKGRVNIDDLAPSKVKQLHPTLKKCACGWIGTKTKFFDHIDEAEGLEGLSAKEFWTKHGEIPLNVGDEE